MAFPFSSSSSSIFCKAFLAIILLLRLLMMMIVMMTTVPKDVSSRLVTIDRTKGHASSVGSDRKQQDVNASLWIDARVKAPQDDALPGRFGLFAGLSETPHVMSVRAFPPATMCSAGLGHLRGDKSVSQHTNETWQRYLCMCVYIYIICVYIYIY